MPKPLNYGWRWFATGMSFLVFGITAALFSVLLFPVCCLWPFPSTRQRTVTTLIHWYFRSVVAVLQWVGVMSLEVSGRAALRSNQPGVVVANHPTYLDVIVLLALIPSACCVVKHVHWRNPCLWGIVRAAGYVSNADPVALVDQSVARIAAGYTMIIFPEGSRSPQLHELHLADHRAFRPGACPTLHPFCRGFAHIALKSMAPVVPVLIHCHPLAFTKRMRWYDVPVEPFCLRITVIDTVDSLPPSAQGEPSSIHTARTLTTFVETTIKRRLIEYGYFET